MNLSLRSLKCLKKLAVIGMGAMLLAPVSALAISPITFQSIVAKGDDVSPALKLLNTLPAVREKSGKYKSEDIPLHTELNASSAFPQALDSSQVAGLWRGDISIDLNNVYKDYRTHEEVVFGGARLETGLSLAAVSGESASAEHGDKPFLRFMKNDVKYKYVFDDALDVNNRLANASLDHPIRIKILGKPVYVIGATDTTLTTLSGDYCTLQVGENCVTGDGHKVEFISGSQDGARIKIDDDQTEWILSENPKTFKNGLNIFLEKVHDIGQSRNEFEAEVWISDTEAKRKYTTDDAFIGEDDKNPDLVWQLASLSSATPSINVTWFKSADMPDEVTYVGSSTDMMKGLLTISPEKLTKAQNRKYEISTDVVDLYFNEDNDATVYKTSRPVIKIYGNDTTKTSIKVNGKDTDTIWIMLNTAGGDATKIGLYYKHPTMNRGVLASNITSNLTYNAFTLEFKDTSLQVGLSANWVGMQNTWLTGGLHRDLNITFFENASYTSGDHYNLKLYNAISATDTYEKGFEYLGHYDDDSTSVANDWRYEANGDTGADISGYQKNAMTDAGIVIENPNKYAPVDKFYLYVPEDISDFDVKVSISTAGAKILTNPILLPIEPSSSLIADPEVADTTQPVILVGGPCVNSLTAKALGLTFPACGESSGLKEGEAVVKLVEDALDGQTALLVYGWDAEATRAAAEKALEFTGEDIKFNINEQAGSSES